MSLDLVDLRSKITPETDAVLEAFNRASGKDKSEIVREVLHAWASDRINEASLLKAMLASKGLSGPDKGN